MCDLVKDVDGALFVSEGLWEGEGADGLQVKTRYEAELVERALHIQGNSFGDAEAAETHSFCQSVGPLAVRWTMTMLGAGFVTKINRFVQACLKAS
jgi:hypothetical protein